jgi:hypothetical protein
MNCAARWLVKRPVNRVAAPLPNRCRSVAKPLPLRCQKAAGGGVVCRTLERKLLQKPASPAKRPPYFRITNAALCQLKLRWRLKLRRFRFFPLPLRCQTFGVLLELQKVGRSEIPVLGATGLVNKP